MKIRRLRMSKMMTQRLIGLKVVSDPIIEKKWNWAKGELKRYKQKECLRNVLEEDIVAARDCIERSMSSSWWHWCDGSHPFFWR